MEVEMKIRSLVMDPATNTPIVVLKDAQGTAVLPIWVGVFEANAIALEIEKVQTPRPMTHDLCKNMIIGLSATLRRVQITRVENNTYFGELHLERGGEIVQVDSRPSDAIAIAVRLDAPIFAAESLLMLPEEDEEEDSTESFSPPTPAERDASELSAEQLKRYLEHLRPEDFGKFNL